MNRPSHVFASSLLVLLSLVACGDASEFDPEDEATGDDLAAAKKKKKENGKEAPGAKEDTSLLVLDLNLENVPHADWGACKGSGADFVHYLGEPGNAPDLFTVQQINDQSQAESYAAALKDVLGVKYDFLIAETTPASYTSACPTFKDSQTNAIFYRSSRLELVSNSLVTFQPKRSLSPTCADGEASSLSRTRALGAKFRDKKGSDSIGVVALHLPKDDLGCVSDNIIQANEVLKGIGGNLRIMAGDMNRQARSEGTVEAWFNTAMLLGYTDAISDACEGKLSCLSEQWTARTVSGAAPRIDFIFTRRASGNPATLMRADTVTYPEVRKAAKQTDSSLDYSDHRAVRARFKL